MRRNFLLPLHPLLLASMLLSAAPATAQSVTEFTEIHMALPVRVIMYGSATNDASTAQAARLAFARIAQLDAIFSNYRPDSEISSLSGKAGEWVQVSPDLWIVIEQAIDIARRTNGAFDPTVGNLVKLWRGSITTGLEPSKYDIKQALTLTGWQRISMDSTSRSIQLLPGMLLDLGAIAKGYILNEALLVLRNNGISSALLEAGGDIVAGDPPPGMIGWRIDLPNASRSFAEKAELLANKALSISGPEFQFVNLNGIRYSHVIDPRSGKALSSPIFSRVLGENAMETDALSTALSVMSEAERNEALKMFTNVVSETLIPDQLKH